MSMKWWKYGILGVVGRIVFIGSTAFGTEVSYAVGAIIFLIALWWFYRDMKARNEGKRG